MSDNTDRDDDEETRDGSIPLGNVFETLSELLDTLEDVDLDADDQRSGRVTRGDATFDYNVNIGSINPAGESRRNRRQRDWDIKGESDDHEYRVRVNEASGELVVIADLPAVSPDDVEVGTTDDALEIRVDGAVVESVPLDWDGAAVTDVTFKNQVLEVRVAPPDGTDDTDGETET
jgi:HSP20 family molecular chaperone IbpA